MNVLGENRGPSWPRRAAFLALVALLAGAVASPTARAVPAPAGEAIKHIIVIVQENHSFDNIFGQFPGADGIANAGATTVQVGKDGNPYPTLPQPLSNSGTSPPFPPDPRFPADLPNGPFLLNTYVRPDEKTGDTWHRFYQEQLQIDGGKMDGFVAWSDNGGLTMGYWDTSQLPLTRYAEQYTLMDNFFHSAFGGSFLAHTWLICACTPIFPDAPEAMKAKVDASSFVVKDGELSPGGHVVNTAYTVYTPHPSNVPPERLLPPQTMPTIGDRLNEKGISWAWYAGGWDDALAGQPDPQFKFHHQPFAYFQQFGDGTEQKQIHLRDEKEILPALQDGSLPAVSFVKPIGQDNEHPGYADLQRGQQHVVDLLRAIEQSPVWNDAVVIVTYDENGGQWDHVAPPKIDEWGPGSRVPALIISPFARRGYVDHTQAEHTSILALIEWRYGLQPLGTRDASANNLTQTLTLP